MWRMLVARYMYIFLFTLKKRMCLDQGGNLNFKFLFVVERRELIILFGKEEVLPVV